MDGHALRSALGLCVTAAKACARPPPLCQAYGLVAGRGSRGARALDRPIGGLVAAGSISHRLCGRSQAGGDRIRLELRLRARIGAGRICRDSPARSLRADLYAQARRRRELGHGGRCGGRRRPPGIRNYREGEAVSMSSLAKRVIMPRDEPHSAEEVRPEELRVLEAMLFASAEPLDETALA